MQLRRRVEGLDDLIESLEETRKRLKDFRPFLEDFAKPEMHLQADELFELSGATEWGRWAKLKASTVAQKTRAGYDLRILHRKGRLRRAYTQDSPDSRVKITKNRLLFTNTVPYAGFHESGTSRMPARKVVSRNRAQ